MATKYAIIIPDGCADEPLAELGGRTPLQAADVPTMDTVARLGIVGGTNNVPPQFTPGSEVANMTLFGSDPHKYFTGRAPIEAAAQGIELGPNDWAIRCNIVTVQDQIMIDFTADHISTADATALLAVAQRELGTPNLEFVPGVSYRNLLLYRAGDEAAPFSGDTRTTAPHDLTDLSIGDDYPRGPGSDLLTDLMARSVAIFADHPINVARAAAGKPLATNLWLWGLGRTPTLENFASRFGIQGAMITAVDLLRGLAALIGWDRIEVEGATGYLDTNYAGKGAAAVEALDKYDIVCVHIEATDEASHEGRCDAKLEALHQIDQHVVAPVLKKLQAHGDYRLLVLPDHPTYVRTKKHEHGFVPFAICGSDIQPDSATTYDEISASKSKIQLAEGWELMQRYFIK